MMLENQIPKQNFHFGHLSLVLSVTVLLLGISWMKNPDLFAVFKSESNSSLASNLPRYYAYQPPAELSQPLIAGASTEPVGPMVINEDGTISSAVEVGDVLGVDTVSINLNLEAIPVKEVSDSDENFKTYISAMNEIEGGYLDSSKFESALASAEQAQIDQQAEVIQNIVGKINNSAVPKSFAQLHKLKILQYYSAIEILKHFTTADENPELINKNLTVFLQTEQELQIEASKLNPITQSLNYETSGQ